ncbi:hypothetical protein LTR53_014611 [Teratosphaeriaceae sp. CCFEE 6253]|nr:hypothetical protein LTR53_014611 [Teratosphaeriaceae sp. CCFEE 6253]
MSRQTRSATGSLPVPRADTAVAAPSRSSAAAGSDGGDESEPEPPPQGGRPAPGAAGPARAPPEDEPDVAFHSLYTGQVAVPLAHAGETASVQYGEDKTTRADAWMTGLLRVYTDKTGLSRLDYKASFFLRTDLDNPKADLDGPMDQPLVGLIDAWRIDKYTAANPGAKQGWRLDFLAPVADDQTNETQLCLQALFDERGVVRPKVVALQQELRDHGLIFIQLVYTLDEYQKRSLMRLMLTLFRSLVRQLPEWFAFDDTLVLVPAKPDGSAGDSWGRRRLLGSPASRGSGKATVEHVREV